MMSSSIREAYSEGHGGILVRSRMHIEDGSAPQGDAAAAGGRKKARRAAGNGRALVVVTELPYQTNKAALVEQIARLVDAGTITGVSDVRDESDRDGMRVVVEVKRGGSGWVGVGEGGGGWWRSSGVVGQWVVVEVNRRGW